MVLIHSPAHSAPICTETSHAVYAQSMVHPRRSLYVRRPDRPVAAIRLLLDTDGLVYRKWGGEQRAKPGDWIVDNDGDVYTVDADVFARTYRQTAIGAYVKTTPVWALRATEAGSVKTKEGFTHYRPGDYLVSNNSDGSDEYAMRAEKFEDLYMPGKDR
jgi:hypothetical protein